MKNPEFVPPVKIRSLLKEPLIIPALRAGDREGVLKEMAGLLSVHDGRLSGKNLCEEEEKIT